jgi:hypothetical protein
MLRANYTDEEKQLFQSMRYDYPDRRIMRRFEILWLHACGKLQFLPSYSLNLNLIERLWKFVKKKCLYNIYYETFNDFKTGINDCLARVDTDYKNELKTLMTTKFQVLKKETY